MDSPDTPPADPERIQQLIRLNDVAERATLAGLNALFAEVPDGRELMYGSALMVANMFASLYASALHVGGPKVAEAWLLDTLRTTQRRLKIASGLDATLSFAIKDKTE